MVSGRTGRLQLSPSPSSETRECSQERRASPDRRFGQARSEVASFHDQARSTVHVGGVFEMSVPVLPFSKVRHAGSLVFLAGELPLSENGSIPDGIGPQTDLTLRRIA